jgi:hypothetical protein
MKVRILLVVVGAALAVFAVTGVVLAQRPAAFDLKFGSLNGANEVNGGDPDGVGTATGTIVDDDTLCYAFTAKNLGTTVAAHIHKGTRGTNGPVVIPLLPPTPGSAGTVSGCVDGIDPALIEDLRRRPDRYYWNIHTDEFPGGAIRGQVFNHR